MPDKSMSTDELQAWLKGKLSGTLNEDGNELSSLREDNFDYYMGKPYGNERKGYSRVVTREVFEAVEWALPSILRAFTAGDRVVSFTPSGPNDEGQADQDTDAVNYYFLNKANGFTVLYEAIKEALTYPNSYVKLWMDECKEVTTQRIDGVTTLGLVQMNENPDIEILEVEERVEPTELGDIQLFDVKLRRTRTRKKLCAAAVPPENMLIASDHTALDLDECDFIGHREQRTDSWLLEYGLTEAQIDGLGDTDAAFGGEAQNRQYTADESTADEDPGAGMRKHWVYEIICRVDFDGDGIAERRKILMVGSEIFENEEYDGQPYVSFATMLNPHRHVGYSLAESVKDIQLISSTLMRQLLDNVYRQNVRRQFVASGALVAGGATLEALADITTQIVPVNMPGMIQPEEVPSILGEILPVMQQWNDVKKVRTGISPELSLNPDILKGATMGAFTNALENASQRIEMIVRLMGETAVKSLMLKVHRLLRENMDVPEMIRLRGKWVEVDPSRWDERTDVTVEVGLGFNSKDKNIAAAMSLLQIQQQAAQAGFAQPINVWNALAKLVEAYGFKNPEAFFTHPDNAPQKGPDPQQDALKAQLQLQEQTIKVQQQAVDNDRARVQLEGERQQMQIQEGMVKLRQKQQELEQSAEQQRTELASTLATIQQNWEKVEQGWAKIELEHNKDLNQPGIGQ